jgi:tRNA nucleotidyltransferase/poly(A) polymerase
MSFAFNPSSFISQLPDSWVEVYSVLRGQGLIPTLVGGVPRDFFLFQTVGRDWDVELTHPTVSFNKDTWKELSRALSPLGKVSFLPYEIIRLKVGEVDYEFSPPRREIFPSNWQQAGHSNFSAEFDLGLAFEESIKRRDFTINAMGLRFLEANKIQLLDPLQGLVHLEQKILHPCGADFSKDPVRFLRALRFSLKFHFHFSQELKAILEAMPVESLTPSYVWSEIKKSSHPVEMLHELYEWQSYHPRLPLPLPRALTQSQCSQLKALVKENLQHENLIIALEWMGVSSSPWQQYFSLPQDSSTRLIRWAQSAKSLLGLHPESFHGEFHQIRELPEFEKLFDWYFTTKHLLQKYPALPLLQLISEFLPEWIYLYQFEALKDVRHIDPPLRAKYQVWNLCQRL